MYDRFVNAMVRQCNKKSILNTLDKFPKKIETLQYLEKNLDHLFNLEKEGTHIWNDNQFNDGHSEIPEPNIKTDQ